LILKNKGFNINLGEIMTQIAHLPHNSHSRYGLIFDMALDGILLLSYPEGKIEAANPYILKKLGYSMEELFDKSLWEIGLLADQEKAETAHNELLKNGFIRYDNLDLVKKTGEQLAVEIICNSYNIDHQKIIQCNIRDITDRRASEADLALIEKVRLVKQLKSTVKSLSNVIEARDPFTAGHQKRVAHLVSAIATDMGLTPTEIEGLNLACLVHDIGKISIPAEILTKPSALTPLEVAMLRSHAQIGFDILKPLIFPWPVAQFVLQHHERLDGSGYPNGLKGDDICLGARIIGVADTVEAMSSNRPYRPALGLDAALNEITNNRGILFDPRVVDICLNLFKEKGYQLPTFDGTKLFVNGNQNGSSDHTL
jgi:PAS domain S-box-containing protein/putative nucleotidyltransferase with HDIG domain